MDAFKRFLTVAGLSLFALSAHAFYVPLESAQFFLQNPNIISTGSDSYHAEYAIDESLSYTNYILNEPLDNQSAGGVLVVDFQSSYSTLSPISISVLYQNIDVSLNWDGFTINGNNNVFSLDILGCVECGEFYSMTLAGLALVTDGAGNLQVMGTTEVDTGPLFTASIGDGDMGGSFNTVLYASNVPVPAAAWLFGSALIGLAGIKRKK
jgi:hypothetical protein